MARQDLASKIQSAASYLGGPDGQISDKDLTRANLEAVIKQARSNRDLGAVEGLVAIRSLYQDATRVPGGGLDKVATSKEFANAVTPNLNYVSGDAFPRPVMDRIKSVLKTDPDAVIDTERKIGADPTRITVGATRVAEFKNGAWAALKE